MANMGFEIVTGETNRPHRVIGPVKARVGALFIFSAAPTVDQVNWKFFHHAGFRKLTKTKAMKSP